MNCPNCGGAVAPGTNRCRKCGSYIEPAGPAAQPPQPPPFQVQPVQLVQTLPIEAGPVGAPVKSKLVAGLLGIFLGALGIHRFYLGYVGIGVVQVLLALVFSWLTCGVTAIVAGIWGLIEGICILTGVIDRDARGRPLKET